MSDSNKKKFWKINEFSKLLDHHVSTINGYFKDLEDSGTHYVERIHGQRVYDELDFQIATYIKNQRKSGWSIDGIMTSLRENPPPVELRPFPPEYKDGPNELSLTTVTEIQNVLRREIDNRLLNHSEEVETYLEENRKKIESKMDAIRTEERQQAITDLITTNRIQIELEYEALQEWEKQDPAVRYTKTWFKRTENLTKKELFIKGYIKENFEKKMFDEFQVKIKSNQVENLLD